MTTSPVSPLAPPRTPEAGGIGATVRAGFAPGVVLGFAGAGAMWIVWWLTHLPAIAREGGGTASPIVTGILVLLTLALLIARAAPGARPAPAWLVGALAGVVSALLNLMLLLSKLAAPAGSVEELAANQLQDNALQIILGFTLISGAVGAAAGWLGGLARRPRAHVEPVAWHARLTLVLPLLILPLVVVGGAVTSTESGMAVPDAVTTYNALPWLFPIELMSEPRIFLEHTHRLFGWLVGVCALTIAIWTTVADRRVWARALVWGVGLAIGLQGLLGILRVGANEPAFALLHGVLAQLVFAATILQAALLLLPASWRLELLEPTRRAAKLLAPAAGVAFGALLIQLVLGATSRHFGADAATWAHVAFSLIVVGALLVTGFCCLRSDRLTAPGRTLRRVGLALAWLVGVQFLLGWATLGLVGGHSADTVPIPVADELATAHPIRTVEALVATTHQATGALLVGLVALAATLAVRLRALARA